jgi:ankyrin repeat protein
MSVVLYIFAYAPNDRVRTPLLQELVSAVQNDDLPSLRARLHALCDLWESSEGKHTLRRLASLAASLGLGDMLFFFLETYHVPVHASHEKLFGNDSHLTPLLCSFKYQDLALELLSSTTVDMSLCTYTGYNLVQMAIKAGAAPLVKPLLKMADDTEMDLDLPSICQSKGHTALCTAAMEGDLESLNALLGTYEERGMLTEALMHPCDPCKRFKEFVRPFPLLYHAKNLATARLLVTWLGDSVGPPVNYHGSPGPVHRSAAGGDLSLLKFFTEECGIPIDEPEEGECVCSTPLASACKSMRSTPEVIRYLLDNGADAVMRGFPGHCRSPMDLALMHRKKDLYRLILRHEAEKTQEATRNLMFELEAIEEVRSKKKKKKNKPNKQQNREFSSEDTAANEADDDFADLPSTSALTVSDKRGKIPLVDVEGDAPREFVCPIEFKLMVDDPVLAGDGFVYSRSGLEAWIVRCQLAGLPLTSPLTGEVMGAAFYENKTHRAMVRRWVEEAVAAAASR